jgi:AcrR family transcriptional regulator
VTKQAPARGAAKQRLLDATIDYVARHGLGDLSLRQLAAAIGTSHRMLIYHFGSKDGLLVEVVRAVEQRERDALTGAGAGAGTDRSEGELLRRSWKRLSNPRFWAQERLFFELYGQALQDRGHTAALLDDIVESWLQPVAAELTRRRGLSKADARAEARLLLAVVRGLLLDLLATGDRAGVDRAMEHFIARYEASARSGSA